ncbi:MAG TPA: carboxypeptidase-like regulatory domain-containing protein, partial [candidate division Zixibacteria bacterium]|nr:carboxypeptidase-like regulatory domain-containing protein [candidate division Zixibacteria bacterium]
MKSPVAHTLLRRLQSALVGLITLQLCFSALPSRTQAQVPCLAGFVQDPGGAPVVNADLDFDNALTGQRLVTPGDNTDASGFYSVCVLPGLYHISFAPPPGTRLLGQRFTNVSLQSSLELNVTLQTGVVISGVITDSLGNPIGGVDLDVDVVGGQRLYTPGDNSDSLTGAYRIVVPPGLHRISFEPFPGDPWIAQRFDSVLITNDTVINLKLTRGVLLSGTLRDQSTVHVANVDLSLKDVATGAKVFLANSRSDSLGVYSVVAEPGLYTAQFSPPPGARLIGVQLDSVSLSIDTTIDVTLVDGHLVNITIVDSDLVSQSNADVDITDETTRARLFLPYDLTNSTGAAQVAVPTGVYEIKADPPPGGILDRVIVRNISITADTSMTLVLPIREVIISGLVVDATGAGIVDVTIGARSGSDGSLLRVRRGTTASDGSYAASVPLVATSVWFSPPRGSHYRGT